MSQEEGKSSRELFEKARVNAPFFGISGFWVGLWAFTRFVRITIRTEITTGRIFYFGQVIKIM